MGSMQAGARGEKVGKFGLDLLQHGLFRSQHLQGSGRILQGIQAAVVASVPPARRFGIQGYQRGGSFYAAEQVVALFGGEQGESPCQHFAVHLALFVFRSPLLPEFGGIHHNAVVHQNPGRAVHGLVVVVLAFVAVGYQAGMGNQVHGAGGPFLN